MLLSTLAINERFDVWLILRTKNKILLIPLCLLHLAEICLPSYTSWIFYPLHHSNHLFITDSRLSSKTTHVEFTPSWRCIIELTIHYTTTTNTKISRHHVLSAIATKSSMETSTSEGMYLLVKPVSIRTILIWVRRWSLSSCLWWLARASLKFWECFRVFLTCRKSNLCFVSRGEAVYRYAFIIIEL